MPSALRPPSPANCSSLLLGRRGGEGLPVVYAGRDEAGRLAAVELARFISRLAACRVNVLKARPGTGPCLELLEGVRVKEEASGGADAFRRTVSPAGVTIASPTGRGLLYGAYDLLEDLGCRWYYPGPVGQRVPHLGEARLSYGEKESSAAFPDRSLILGHDLYLDDVEGWVEWAARNRLSNVFLHVFPPPALGGRPSGYWRQALARAVPAAKRRGLVVEFGGHGLTTLLPRRLFGEHPEYFRYDGRRRTPDHNFCPTSAGALDVVRRQARAYFQAHPGADLYHLWPDDIVGGGWCRCENCSSLSPSDQALLATNAVAGVLAEVAPGARLAFLAYHDTVEPPARVRPRPNVSFLYAPRERCYAHALDDSSCEVNRPYHRSLLAGLAAFGTRADGGFQGPEPREDGGSRSPQPGVEDGSRSPEPRVFEYYLDAILFKSMLPPLARVIARDLKAYLAAGVHTVGALMTSDRPWVSVPANLWLWGRLTWNPGADLDRLLADLADGVLGRPDLARYYEDLERAFARILELDGQEVLLRMPGAGLLDSPPADTLDFLGGSPEARERKLGQLREAADLVADAGRLLAGAASVVTPASASPSGPGVTLAGERADVELVAHQVAYLEARQEALVAAGPPERGQSLSRAWRALGDVARWGRRNLAGGLARAQFLFVHAPWELQLLLIERTGGRPGGTAGARGGPRHRDYAALGRLALRYLGLRLRASGRRRPSPYHRTSG